MKHLIAFAIVFMTQASFAQTISVDQATIGGTSCSEASAVVLLNEGQTKLKLKLEKYELSPSAKLERKTCTVAIPVAVPSGSKLIIEELKLKEEIGLDKSQVTASVEAFFAGSKGQMVKSVMGSLTEQIEGELLVTALPVLASKCGQSTILRLNSSLLAPAKKKLGAAEKAKISEITLSLKLVDC